MDIKGATYSVGSKVKQYALWFIQLEKERILHNFYNGTTSREQAIGGLNTLYQIASHIHDVECMKNLWLCITDVRNSLFPELRSSDHFSIG